MNLIPRIRNTIVIIAICVVAISAIVWRSTPTQAEPAKTTIPSPTRVFALRLAPGQDLKKELMQFARNEGLKAPVILTCVGSLTHVNLRYANQEKGTERKGHFEIVSLVGMLDPAGGHIHMSVSDGDGVTTGGHLLDGCIVYTTAEVAIAELEDCEFLREVDKTFGYKELVVKHRTRR